MDLQREDWRSPWGTPVLSLVLSCNRHVITSLAARLSASKYAGNETFIPDYGHDGLQVLQWGPCFDEVSHSSPSAIFISFVLGLHTPHFTGPLTILTLIGDQFSEVFASFRHRSMTVHAIVYGGIRYVLTLGTLDYKSHMF